MDRYDRTLPVHALNGSYNKNINNNSNGNSDGNTHTIDKKWKLAVLLDVAQFLI